MTVLLRLVNDDTGEIVDLSLVQALRDQLAGAEKEVRAWRTRYANLKRDKQREAEEHRLWPVALELHAYWRAATNHPRSKWSADCFFEALPLLQIYGADMFRRAIDGIAFDHYTVTRRNGSVKRFDGWDFITKNSMRFEEAANRAPKRSAPAEKDYKA